MGTFWARLYRLFYKIPDQFLRKIIVLSVYFKITRGRLLLSSFLGRSNSTKIMIFVKITTFRKIFSFYSSENQLSNFLKIAANSQRAVVLSSKLEADRSLIRIRNADHKVMGICGTYEIPLYCITRWKVVLSVPISRVPMVVYILKVKF